MKTISITKEHLAKAIESCRKSNGSTIGEDCLVAQAFKDQLPEGFSISITRRHIILTDTKKNTVVGIWDATPSIIEYISCFDSSRWVTLNTLLPGYVTIDEPKLEEFLCTNTPNGTTSCSVSTGKSF